MSFNDKHPELKEGERWLTNMTRNPGDPSRPRDLALSADGKVSAWGDMTFLDIPYKSKRAGATAYNINGKELPYLYPVFVSIAEDDQRQKEAEKLITSKNSASS